MGWLARIRLYLVSADPGRVALRVGLRVMVTIAAVCLALIVISRWIPMQAPSYVLAMITAIQGAAQVNDRTAATRALTRVYAALGGFIVIAGIALADKSLLKIDILLLVVVFIASYVRRFGPRWQAGGMFTFMCGVVGAFLEAPEGELLEIALALAVSGVVAHLVHDYVLPDRPARDFRRVVAATLSLSAQLRQMIDTPAPAQRNNHPKDTLLVARQLSNDIRMCQNYLPMQVEGSTPGADASSAVTLRLLDLQLAAESALDQASVGDRHGPQAEERVQQQLKAMQGAEDRLEAAVAELPASFPGAASPPAGAKPQKPGGHWYEDEQLRLAIQVTLACALAMLGGRLISSDRWFWAVLTAFLVFMNTRSAGAVAVRGMSRAIGTLAGIVLGIALASLVKGNLYLTLPLTAIAVFGSFYLARISYAGMNVCINVAIALIYGLVGIFTPELLVLRLEETAIGAAAGIFCALAIMPVKTLRTAEQAVNRLLVALRSLIGTIIEVGEDQPQKTSVTAAAGAVDAAFAGVMGVYAPLLSVWTLGLAQANANTSLRRAYLLAHAAHLLEGSLREDKPAGPELQELRSIYDRLGALTGEEATATHVGSPEARLAERQVELEIPNEPVRYAIQIMSDILRQMETGNRPP